ncbi:thymidine phosphorylase isoform X2 [Phyllobates terribilis]|uniref:thymidine phosphorylase isoform X2 n=1 Tax=Phyllobates terribilis TaxID=111132 RepID=UPI003CCB0B96
MSSISVPGGEDASQFRISDVIAKKRDGLTLSPEEIRHVVKVTMSGQAQECQLGALLMSIRLRGMNPEETMTLTKEMVASGCVLEWPKEWSGLLVDKHSTGGVGDKVSLPLAPALAACGCKVPMISGRGLGHTGGTLDKLESVPGFSSQQNPEQMMEILRSVGCCIVGQSKNLVPADKIFYEIRDVTATVDSLPLITGNSLEVIEALECLEGRGPEDLKELVLQTGGHLLWLCGQAGSATHGAEKIANVLRDGSALQCFRKMLEAQGVKPDIARTLSSSSKLGKAAHTEELTVPKTGTVELIQARPIAEILNALGAGRKKATDIINHCVGAELLVRVGQRVEKGAPWIRIHYEKPLLQERHRQILQNALCISDQPAFIPTSLIMDVIRAQGRNGEHSDSVRREGEIS